jgi:outer membrane protein assembly factor BamB
VVFQDTHALTEAVSPGSIEILDVADGHLEPYYVAPSHALTLPLFYQDRFIVRTAESKLYALDRNDPTKVIWKYPLKTWWATPMNLVDGKVVLVDGNTILSNGTLLAIDAQNGSLCWKKELEGWPTKLLAGSETQLAFINNKVELQVLDVRNGKTLGQREFASIYSSPVLHEDQVILSVRGGTNKQSPNYYSLISLSRQTGEPKWQVPLPCRVRIPPACQADTILLADDAHNLTALSNVDGATRWTYSLSDGDDFIHTHVLLTETLAVFGTYFGQLVAINTKEEQNATESPAVCIEKGDWKSAAQAHALASNFVEAADIYAEKLGEVDKALQLYERGNAFAKAARLASDNKLYSLALEYYRNAHDVLGEAETLLQMEDLEGAANLFIGLDDIPRAASLMEQAGKLKTAADLFRRSGNNSDWIRILQTSEFDDDLAEELRKQGYFEAAATWEINAQKFLEAAFDFQTLGRPQDEFDALKQHIAQASSQVAQWIWQRLAGLGEQLGDYLTAAEAWLELESPKNAGFAYLTHAQNLAGQINKPLVNIPENKKKQLAELFLKAADAFDTAFLVEHRDRCLQEVNRYQQLPKVIIPEAMCKSGFRELEWNTLTLPVKNVGYGTAKEVTINITEDLFELLPQFRTIKFNLAAEGSRPQEIRLKPKEGSRGETVPLEINWSWKDKRGAEYQVSESVTVKVLAKYDPRSTGGPITVNIGDTLNIIRNNGNPYEGGIALKSSDGGQIGASISKKIAELRESVICECPICHREIESVAKYCPYCQTLLTKAQAKNEDGRYEL